MVWGLLKAQALFGYYGNLPSQPAAISFIPGKEWVLNLLAHKQNQDKEQHEKTMNSSLNKQLVDSLHGKPRATKRALLDSNIEGFTDTY